MTSDIKGIFFRDFNNSYIPNILEELYREKVYDQFLGDRENLTILDIGGNVGLFTFYAYPYAKKIYIVEPSKPHVEVINTMLEHNKMAGKVTVIDKAVSDKDGEATFYHNENVTMFSLKEEVNSKPEEKETVPTIRLDTLFTQYKIDHVDFMKLDIEGSEVDVVNSLGFKNVASKIDSMVIEYHQWARRNPSQLTTTLMDLGFEVFPIPSKAALFGARRIKGE